MERTVPKLAPKGWLHDEDVSDRLDAVMAYAFSSDNSQSVTFAGKITSVQWIISTYSNNTVELQTVLQKMLDEYLKKQFDTADINVSIETNGAELGIVTSGTITNNGKTADMKYLLTVRSSSLERVVNQLNNMEVYND